MERVAFHLTESIVFSVSVDPPSDCQKRHSNKVVKNFSAFEVKTMCLKLLVCVLLSFSAISVFAQFRAGIQGVVVDPQGEVVGGATVTLTSNETNISKTATSNATGTYNFLALARGTTRSRLKTLGSRRKPSTMCLSTPNRPSP